jgi:hypothetical protein
MGNQPGPRDHLRCQTPLRSCLPVAVVPGRRRGVCGFIRLVPSGDARILRERRRQVDKPPPCAHLAVRLGQRSVRLECGVVSGEAPTRSENVFQGRRGVQARGGGSLDAGLAEIIAS